MSIKTSISGNIERQLINVGWKQNNILWDPIITASSHEIRPDIVLLHNAYPISVIVYQPAISTEDLDNLTVAVMLSAEGIGVSYAYVTDGSDIFEIDAELAPIKRANWPSPSESLARLGIDISDPRLTELPEQTTAKLRIYQTIAVARALDALLSPKHTALISMAAGTGLTITTFQIAWKLLKSGRFKKLLFIGDSDYIIEQAKSAFAPFGEQVVIWKRWTTGKKIGTIHLVESNNVFSNETLQQLRSLPANYYDVIVTMDVQQIHEPLDELSSHFSDALWLGLTYKTSTHTIIQRFGSPVFQYSRQDALADNSIQAPKGFQVVSLKEIAKVSRGISVRNLLDASDTRDGIAVLMGKDIQQDGVIKITENRQIDVNTLSTSNHRATSIEDFLLQENDIIITAINGRTFNRIGLVTSDLLKRSLVYGSSLIRVRVDPELASPVAVYDFFRSDIGQLVLQQHANITSSLVQLTPSGLAQIKIFLPPISEARQQSREQLSGLANSLRQLQSEIIPDLEKLTQTQSDNLATAENPGLALIADKLRQIANLLIPRSIGERVLEEYPTPIALAYRRFDDARFNSYEQVLRLRDLFESISFFVYNVTLADSVRSLAALKLAKVCKSRTAYDESSTARRIGFIRDMIQASQADNSQGLFIAELIKTQQVTERLERLQRDFRNHISHTATATETQQRRIIEEFLPDVKAILEELEFLSTYRLARIPSFYFKQGKIYRRMEVYQGVVPNLIEEAVSDTEAGITRADYNHLILINADHQVLDLHPIYQLISNERTRYETHICFLKQRKGSRLTGESVQGAFSIDLEGAEEFEILRKKLAEDKAA